MNKLSQVLTGLQEMVVSAKDGGEDMLNLWINLVQIHISPKPIFISAGTRCEDEEGPNVESECVDGCAVQENSGKRVINVDNIKLEKINYE